jgi:hypothetical protein
VRARLRSRVMRRLTLVAASLGALAGCGGSSKEATQTGYVHPIGAYVAPGCSSASEERAAQYVAVTSWKDGRLTGNTGSFKVPECADVILYVEADKPDEVRMPKLRIAARVTPGKTAKLEFYAPEGTYPVRLHRNKVELIRIVAGG